MTESKPVGRPPFFSTSEELETAIARYFDNAIVGEYTITGLALALGFSTRKSLLEYESEAEFVNAIKNAKLRIEQDYENSLRKHGRSGDIFGLKNFGWKDTQTHAGDADHPVTLQVITGIPRPPSGE